LPLASHPHGQPPLADFAIASDAPWLGTQNEPDEKYPCGHEPPGPGGFGTGKGSASDGVAAMTAMARMAAIIFCSIALAQPA
jgi:hypothetical protein